MPMRLTNDKFFRAERKNRCEKIRLDDKIKHFDRETSRINYEIDREKRLLASTFKNVYQTSGVCNLGLPPSNENDNVHEKSQLFRQGLRISNKRLKGWRECEKQLHKFIMHSETAMSKGKRLPFKSVLDDTDNVPEPITQPSESTLYTVYNRHDSAEDDVFDDESSKSSSQTCLFRMVKSPLEIDNEAFDVDKWEKEMIENYKALVTRPVSASNTTVTGNKRPQSSPSVRLRYETKDSESDTSRRQRPHTAHGILNNRDPSRKLSLSPRSSSSQQTRPRVKPFLITKEGVYIKTGGKYEKLPDVDKPLEKLVLVNNYVGAGTNSKLHSNLGLGTVQEDLEEEDESHASNYNVTKRDQNDADSNHTLNNVSDMFVNTDKGQEQEEYKGKPIADKFQKEKTELQRRRRRSSQVSLRSASSTLGKFVTADSAASDVSTRQKTHFTQDKVPSHEDNGPHSRMSGSVSSLYVRSSRAGSVSGMSRQSRVPEFLQADISEIYKNQEKLINEITPDKPPPITKVVTIGTLVKAAMTFSKAARKRALETMVKENNADSHEKIRQEHIRRLQSRASVLSNITSTWKVDNEDD
ncbi:hypothetical protein ACJMK2_029049 [Sinanodonta woodiana]|uniref:Uncharacterized protein n=1 Tax=Sinanodonta woodiana TaxID=1069815 RepID=A0ABD3XB96_SINWO